VLFLAVYNSTWKNNYIGPHNKLSQSHQTLEKYSKVDLSASQQLQLQNMEVKTQLNLPVMASRVELG